MGSDGAGSGVTLVVLAGGRSTRFGADKLAAELDGATLLQHCLTDVPPDWELVVVGEPRDLPRPARFVREDPPGTGPAAALVAGVRAAGTDLVVSTPGDAPAGGTAARTLLAALLASEGDAVVGLHADGSEQPLQLAVRGTARRTLAAVPDAANRSARRHLLPLIRPAGVPLPPELTFDVDAPSDVSAFGSAQFDRS